MNRIALELWREAERAVARVEPQRGEPADSPVGRYLDPARHAAEFAALRREPHVMAPSSRLRDPGDWASDELLGVPVLAVRGDDGVLRAFINVCRHRGALVAPPMSCGAGRKRFVCPYHSWTYDSRGTCVGRPHEADFAAWSRAASALVELPVAERAGLVWVVPTSGAALCFGDGFDAIATELEALGYDGTATSPHERRFEQPSNWKLVFDANLESYHFQYAHRETIAPMFHDNLVQHRSFGRHHRIVLPKQSLAELGPVGDDAVTWELLGRHANIIYFVFPTTLLLWEGDHIDGFRATPLAPDRTQTASWMLVPARHATRCPAEYWARNWQIFWAAIDEDYALAASMQRGLGSGANTGLRFGAAEFACERFEKDVEAMLVAAP